MVSFSTLRPFLGWLGTNVQRFQAYPNLMKYARVLLGHCPEPTTHLFIDYYTGKFRPRRQSVSSEDEAPGPAAGGAIQNFASLIPLPYLNTTKATGETDTKNTKTSTNDVQGTTETESEPPAYTVPKPRTAFSSFVDHPEEFITFLEALIRQRYLKEEDKIDLYTTLFEMYLDTANSKKDDSEKQQWEAKAKKLIQGKEARWPSKTHLIYFHSLTFSRYPSPRLMFYFYLICPTSARELPLFENSRGCGRISCALIFQPRTHLAL